MVDVVNACAGRVSFLEGRPGALAVHAALLATAGRQQEAHKAVQVGEPISLSVLATCICTRVVPIESYNGGAQWCEFMSQTSIL